MNITVHPEVKKLKNKLSELIYEYDSLVNHKGPYLEHLYVSIFGFDEYMMYKLELKIKILKRKIQLIRIQINHEKDINPDEIENTLNREFDEYEKQIDAQLDDLNHIMDKKFVKLPEKEVKEIKKVYRQLVKKLHPDLNPKQSAYEKNLFHQATMAFNTNDLGKLKSLNYLCGDEEDSSQIEDLILSVTDFENKINDLKKEYPFNKEKLLSDEKCKKEYKDMLSSLIEERKLTIENLSKQIEGMI